MTAVGQHVDEWRGDDVSIAEVQKRLGAMRTSADDGHSELRTSVMTHTAWVPPGWLDAARGALAGLADAHPSRTILLVPDPEAARDAIDASVSVYCFDLPGETRHICSEVVELHLRGARAQAPASVVEPLLISDLPVFSRWRGRPRCATARSSGHGPSSTCARHGWPARCTNTGSAAATGSRTTADRKRSASPASRR